MPNYLQKKIDYRDSRESSGGLVERGGRSNYSETRYNGATAHRDSPE